jgi:hypothetical protein
MSPSFQLRLDHPVQALDAPAGSTLTLRGYFHSTLDGSTVDAALTSWPDSAPGGASVDSGGLVDFEAGGLHLLSRDPQSHQVQAMGTAIPGAACAAAGISSPCLVLRTTPQAISRLTTTADYASSLKGSIWVEVAAAPIHEPVLALADKIAPYFRATGLALALMFAAAVVLVLVQNRQKSSDYRIRSLISRARQTLRSTDPVLALPLMTVVDQADKALKSHRIEASSEQGRRVEQLLKDLLKQVEDAKMADRADREREEAEDLAQRFQIALEAAQEARSMSGAMR